MPVPSNIKFEIEQDAKWTYIITLDSIDKEALWMFAAQVKALKIPEPYKWKGIRYSTDYIKLKPGKAAKK
jgi:large subunit ribosomal protein L6